MPREIMKRQLRPPLTVTQLIELKQIWGVSIQALIMRAKSVGAITERQQKYLYQQISQEDGAVMSQYASIQRNHASSARWSRELAETR